ncbi:hypothetical protein VP01_5621g1, partial [Puccinia sorghi]
FLMKGKKDTFHIYPSRHSKFSKNTLNHGEIHQYSQIRNRVQAIIQRFNTSEDEKMATAAFFVLDFIQSNYGLEILDIQKGELIQEKMSSTSSKFQLFSELENITWYLDNQIPSNSTLEAQISQKPKVF